MVNVAIERMNEKHVLLVQEEDLFEMVFQREWLPKAIKVGDNVKLHFKPLGGIIRRLLLRDAEADQGSSKARYSDRRPDFLRYEKFLKAVEKSPRHFYRVVGMDMLLATVDAITPEYVLLLVGAPLFKVVISRTWLPEKVKIGDAFSFLIHPKGYEIQNMTRTLPHKKSKRKRGLKLVFNATGNND